MKEKLDAELGKKTSAIEIVAVACQKYFEEFLNTKNKEIKKKKKKIKLPQGHLINKVGNA